MTTPLDISTTADRIVEMLRTNQGIEAMRLLEEQRRNQPPAVQEALDRMVARRGDEALALGGVRFDAQRLDPAANSDAAAINAGLQRLTAATGAPRVPTEAEMAALPQTQRYDVYASIVEARGNDAARESLRNGERVILGLRQETSMFASMTPDDPRTRNRDESQTGRGVYDDRIVVLGGRNPPVVEEFNRASTEPTAQYSHRARNGDPRYAGVIPNDTIFGADVNRDGVRDAGRMREGTIEMTGRNVTHPNPGPDDRALRPTEHRGGAVDRGVNMIERDVNGDGRFNADDGPQRLSALDRTFKIHEGSRGSTDSAGCQTIHRDDYARFMAAVNGNPGQTTFQYVLTETSPGQQPVQGLQEGAPRPQPRPDDLRIPAPTPESLAPETSPRPPARPAGLQGAAMELPDDPLMRQIREAFDRSGAGRGLDPEQRDNVLAASYRAFAPSVDHVGVYNGNVVGTRAPHGLGREPMDNIPINIAQERNTPVPTSLAAVERAEQQRMLVADNHSVNPGNQGIGARA